MAALTNGYASYTGEPRRVGNSLLDGMREAAKDNVFSPLPEEVAKHSHPLLGKNGSVFHDVATTNSLENHSGPARECLGTKLYKFMQLVVDIQIAVL